jgi:hypothetical protein
MNADLHTKYVQGRDALLRTVHRAKPGQLVFGVGLSGAGKSVMEPWLMRKLTGDPKQWKRGSIPAITVRASRSENARFSSKDFQTRLTVGLREPRFPWFDEGADVDPDDLRSLHEDIAETSEFWQRLRCGSSERELRREFEEHAPLRETKWVVVRDAGAMCSTRRGTEASQHILSCMEMAEEIGNVWIVFGTGILGEVWEAHEEISRRALIVFIDRYRETREDRLDCARVALTIGRRFPFSSESLITKHLDLVQANGAGIYGRYLSFFQRCDEARLRAGRTSIEEQDMWDSSLTKAELQALWSSAKEFDRLRIADEAKSIRKEIRSGWAKA